MIQLRRASERGKTTIDWLTSYHTFSFGEYRDEQFVGFGALRVINDDYVAPDKGFATHAHHDMEILTYVLEGELAHRDSLGNGAHIQPGEVQRMTAGTGIMHSEYNPSNSKPVHFLQIWIHPDRKGLAPGYEQKHFFPQEKQDRFCLIASADGRQGSVQIHQDVNVYASVLTAGQVVRCTLNAGRRAWVQVARGKVRLNSSFMVEGDGAGVTDEKSMLFECQEDAELLVLDLA